MERVLTRVEGEGKVLVKVKEGNVIDVEIQITEAPRFFEYIVRGKHINNVVEIVSRVCGLCGVSYMLTATRAFEKCLKIDVPQEVEELRRIIHLAERVKSHVIHVFLLNLPDFLEMPNSFRLGAVNSAMLRNSMKLLTLAANIMDILGGRMHNVVNIKIGGVYKPPSESDAVKIVKLIKDAIELFKPLADFVLSLKNIPEEKLAKPLMILHGNGYPHVSDEIAFYNSENAEIFDVQNFENVLDVMQRHGKTALLYKYKGQSYIVGPFARFNTSYDKLHGEARDFVSSYGWKPPLKDVRQQIIARVAEILDSLLTLRDFFQNYKPFEIYSPRIEPGKADKLRCVAAVEAPRGILYHRYDIDEKLKVLHCNIITPTAQNILAMEELSQEKLRMLGRAAEHEAAKLTERIVRAFDPCISCSVHVLSSKY